MTLDQKREKIVNFILSRNRKELYEEVKWLVTNTVINDIDVIECYRYVFEDNNKYKIDEDYNITFKKD
tara:strand:- start:441 stop:644 length:204 start_codon:yes stop_codon:yes gene_type:complete